jgi:hypothetical protein
MTRFLRPRVKLGIQACLVLAVAVMFLFSPQLPDQLQGQYCMANVRVFGRAGFPLNCDSYRYMDFAQHPRLLLARESWLQSRPLHVLCGSLLGYALTSVLPLANFKPHPFYPALVLLNFAALLTALVLFDRLFLPGDRLSAPVLIVSLLLVANHIVKAFVWSPHTQMFNILSPVACMYVCKWIWTAGTLDRGRLAAYALVTGLLPLFYGGFLPLLPAMLLAFVIRWFREGKNTSLPTLAVDASLMSLCFAGPTLWWMAFVRVKTGTDLYIPEVTRYHQFGLITDSLPMGWEAFWKSAKGAAPHLLRVCWKAASLPLGLLLLGAALVVAVRAPLKDILREQRLNLLSAMITLCVFFPFLALSGLYEERFAWNLVPPLLAILAALTVGAHNHLDARRGAAVTLVLGFLASGLFIHELLKPFAEILPRVGG